MRSVDEDCYTAVKEGTAQVELLLSDGAGLNTLRSLFNLCQDLEEGFWFEKNVANFFSTLAGNFAGKLILTPTY